MSSEQKNNKAKATHYHPRGATSSLLILSLAFIVSACVEFDAAKMMKINLPQEWANKIENESKPQKVSFGWWKSAKDEKLNEVVEKILSQNLSLKQAYFRLASAREDAVSQNYLPKLDLNSSLNANRVLRGETGNFFLLNNPKKPNSYYRSSLDASWELPLFGQFDAAKRAYKADSYYAVADINLIKTSLISETIRVYSQMRLEQNRIAELNKMIAAQKRITNYVEVKLAAGFADEIELNQTKRESLLLENELLQAQASFVSYCRQLAKLMGESGFNESFNEIKNVPEFELPNFSNTVVDVVRNRPDVEKAEADVLKALAANILARSELFPKITLGGSISISDNFVNKPTLGRSIQASGTPTISIPLFDFGKRLANDRIKKAQLLEYVEKYKEAVISSVNEVETNLSAYDKAISREKNLSKASDNLHKISQKITALNLSGIKDGIDLEKASINKSRGLINFWEAKVETISQLTLLAKSMGSYYENPHKTTLYEKK